MQHNKQTLGDSVHVLPLTHTSIIALLSGLSPLDSHPHCFLLSFSFVSPWCSCFIAFPYNSMSGEDWLPLSLTPSPATPSTHTHTHVCAHSDLSYMLRDGCAGGKKQVEELCLAGVKYNMS